MSYITLQTDVDVYIDDFYSELGSRDKAELVEWLKEDGYLTQRDTEYEENTHPMQDIFNESIDKIKNSYHLLSSEERELIESIAKKY
jgi:hypothetical protein